MGLVLPGNEYVHFREEFVPFDLTPDASLAQRLADVISGMQRAGKHFDGILSIDEHLLAIVSHAATRQLDANAYARLVRSPADLEALLAEEDSGRPPPPYPLIVKPCKGWSSEGVWKVADERELRARVPMLWQDVFADWHGRDVIVEASADHDDGRTKAEDESAAAAAAFPVTFVETSNMLPSALATSEIEALRQRLHEMALAVGFREGVLHMEARLRNSSSHYAKEEGGDGLVDLQLNEEAASSAKLEDVFLIEINPRPPGWQEVEATAHAYGVSYYSLAVLNALGERDRFAALCRPFVGGAHYHMQLLFVSAQKGGTYRSGDVCAAVLDHDHGAQGRRLRDHVVKCANLMQDGQEVPDPRTGKVLGSFIAFFLVASRTSRWEAIRIGHEIEQLVRTHTNGF
ncbi:glutathione synthetase ATP-binding protein [Colletotrichum musicola]|uniref:Glutathione synthetase ATP-binding protein n=1 Tax=Colletotrichum musicola TaxID=2175873 RepID=A0A8H6J460_9PEZI|nr:glutathione synthetase ATP-binding protein [Colletotrichum musicola]